MSKQNNDNQKLDCVSICSLTSYDEGLDTSFDASMKPPNGNLNDLDSFSLEDGEDNENPYWVIDPNNPIDVKNHLIISNYQEGSKVFNDGFVVVENNEFPSVGIQGNVVPN